MQCIYCKSTTEVTFKKTEHVLPQSFGKFKDNLVLINAVCDRCNQFFGDVLETKLARDSYEGTLRYDGKIKNKKEFKSLGKRSKIKMRIVEGELKGAYVYREYDKNIDSIKIKPLPQIKVFDKRENRFKFILLDDLPTYSNDYSNHFVVYGIEIDKIIEELDNKGWRGVDLKSDNILIKQYDEVYCEVESEIDELIKRCYVKIAFNYLAVNYNFEDLFDELYDKVRSYVLKGIKSSDVSVVPVNDDILFLEKFSDLKVCGHLITCESNKVSNRIFVNISLFNTTNYCIGFPIGSSKLINDNFKGHFFNLKDFTISDLIHNH